MKIKMQPKLRINYWSNSIVASFIRNVLKAPNKPDAATTNEWNQWTKNQKKNHKIVHWLTDTGLKKLQNFVYFPYDVYYSVNYYIFYSFVKKSHYLSTRLEIGEYHSVSERILNGLFETLVDYVEIDLAKREYFYNPHKYKKIWWKLFRNDDAGLNYLINAACEMEDDKLTKHANEAQNIFNLYNWWKRRPYRPEPRVASELDIFYKKYKKDDTLFLDWDSLSELESKQHTKLYNDMNDIIDRYEKEDQQKMIELIQIINTLR